MFISNIDKAKVLIEALPYIQKYYGKTIVSNTAATLWKTKA